MDWCAYDALLRTNLHIKDPDILVDRDNKLLFKVTDKKKIQCATQFRDKYIISEIDVFITAVGLWLKATLIFQLNLE